MKFISLLSLSLLSFGVLADKVFNDDDPVPIRVKPLTFGGNSYDEKLYLYPVAYYNQTLDNCHGIKQNVTNPEEDSIKGFKSFFNNNFRSSPMNTTFNSEKDKCTIMCDRNYNEVNVTLINDLIKKNYKLNFYVDDTPVGRELYDSQTGKFYIDLGVPLGYLDSEKVPHIFNHFQFVIYYVSEGLNYKIVYSTVSTQSLTRIPQVPLNCNLSPPLLLRYNDNAYNGNRVTYGVIYKEIELHKSINKWDLYKNDVVRPFISNSLVLIFTVLTVFVAGFTYYLLKNALFTEKLNAIYKKREENDNNKSENSSDEVNEIDELYDFSWPALANDVFRLPLLSVVLYYLISLGLLAFVVFSSTVIQLGLGLNPYTSDLFKLVTRWFYFGAILQSVFNSYLAKLFKSLNGSSGFVDLILSGLLNSLFLPLLLSIIVGQTNSAYASVGSPIHISDAKFKIVINNYILITFISFAVGTYFIKINNLNQYPSVNEISKKVSNLPITFKLIPNSIITGIFPFGIILVPLSTVYLTLWYNQFFSINTITLVFQFLLLVTLIVSINVLNLYYLLSIGNWQWQWKSFINGLSLGLYSFIYTFYLTKFRFGDHASFLIALFQNLSISLVFALTGGFLSFTASFFAVKALYTRMA